VDRHREKAELHGSLRAGDEATLQLLAAPEAAEKSYVLHGRIANCDGRSRYVCVVSLALQQRRARAVIGIE
jgi:hypothetical protein